MHQNLSPARRHGSALAALGCLGVTVAVLVAVVAWTGATASPSGASPRRAAPTAPTRDPVIIVAGTEASQIVADRVYAPLAARLIADGYQPFIYGLPWGGLGHVATTARSLHAYIARLMARTGASHVDLIGHSQGGILGRYTIENLGDAAVVDAMISLAAPNQGARSPLLVSLVGNHCAGIPVCTDLAPGSAFLRDLNAGDDTVGDVQYTNLVSALDPVVTPYTGAFLDDDGNNTNMLLQSQCPALTTGHRAMATSGAVYSAVRDALARQTIRLDCTAG